jgi:biopolymer transport protein ExbD
MRLPSAHYQRQRDDGQTMTPMIDVVFLLLIFFVCASSDQVREGLLPTQLSGGSIEASEAIARPRPLGEAWVRVRAGADAGNGPRIEVEGRSFSGPDRHRLLSEFLKTLAATAPELPVILDIDGEVPLGEALAAYDAARAADFDAIHFAVDPPTPPTTPPAAAR